LIYFAALKGKLLQKFKHLFQSSFTRNVFTVLGGSSFSTLLPIAISPLLARLFSPAEGFAPFTFFMSTVYIIAAVANSHYTNAILVADDDEESIAVFQLSSIINILIFTLLFILFLLVGETVMGYFNAPATFLQLLMLIPIMVLSMGLYGNLLQWSFRQQQFKRVAWSRMFQSFITAVVQIAFGYWIPNWNGLIIGFCVGQLAALVVLVFLHWREGFWGWKWLDIKTLKRCAIKYESFLRFQTLADFINVITQQMPTFLLGRFNFIQEVGWFGFANRIIVAPSSIITGALGDVFRQQAAVDYRLTGNALPIFKKTLRILLLVMVLPSLLVLFAGPVVFGWLFGSEWEMAGVYAQVLIIMLFPKFIVSPLSYMYIIARKQREDFWLHVYILLSTVASFYLGYKVWGTAKGMLLCFSVNYAMIYLLYLVRSFTFAKGKKSADALS
jgi:O-antigen/teichoic acid export membrane protein